VAVVAPMVTNLDHEVIAREIDVRLLVEKGKA
jgi:hypothetical protein